MSKTNNDDKGDKNVTLEKVYSKLIDFIDKSSQEKPKWKWWIETAMIPLSTIIFTAAVGHIASDVQRKVDRANSEQAAVESYFMQMEDILLNLEGVEGIIKWSRETEKESTNYNWKIKDKLLALSLMKPSLSLMKPSLSLIKDDLSSTEINLSSIEQQIKKDTSDILSKLSERYQKLFDSLNDVENTIINKEEKHLENKLHSLEVKLQDIEDIDKIQDIPDDEPQIDDEILQAHNRTSQVHEEILTQTSEISTIVDEIKDLDYERNRQVDSYLLDEAQIVVQTKTSNVLFALSDQFRRQAIIEFLRESQLGFITRNSKNDEKVNNIDDQEDDNLFKKSKILYGMALTRTKGIDLSGNDLSFIQLYNGKLNGAILKNAQLSQSMLSNASLIGANLSGASLFKTNLEDAILRGANLKDADLTGANLKGAIFDLGNNDNLNKTQIKSACNWQDAIYKSKWDTTRETWIAIKPANKNFIKEIKNHKSSDPKIPSNCSQWENVDNKK